MQSGFTADQVSELSTDGFAAFTRQQLQLSLPSSWGCEAGFSKGQVSELSPKAIKGFTC